MARARLGPLALESSIGGERGSSVWRAIHLQQRKSLAVKLYSLPFGGTIEAKQEFAQEWETLKRLSHPAIARCYGGGFEDNDAYLAYEIISGESLLERVERRGRLSWEAVLDDMEPIIAALVYLHEKEIVYGALSPDKIRFEGLSPLLLDVRLHRFDSPYRSTRPPSLFELAFRAPEALNTPPEITPKSDLYSLGAVLYYALSGRPPISGPDTNSLLSAAQSGQIEKIGSIVLDCPVWLSSLIDQLLQPNPQDRPHGAGAVALAFQEIRRRAAEGIGVAQHATSGFSPLQVKAASKKEAEALLGVVAEEEEAPDGSAFYEKSWFLVLALCAIAAFVTWFLWPLNEAQLRARAEKLIAAGDRTSMGQAKDMYLQRLVEDYPDGENVLWAKEQIDQIEMLEAERRLELKLSRGGKLNDEGERLYATARQFEQFGDSASALDKYTSLVTLLEDQDKHRPYVNLARRQIAKIKQSGQVVGEAQKIVSQKLTEADDLLARGLTMEARKIWYSVIELYQGNLEMEPFVKAAQQRLAGQSSPASASNQ